MICNSSYNSLQLNSSLQLIVNQLTLESNHINTCFVRINEYMNICKETFESQREPWLLFWFGTL